MSADFNQRAEFYSAIYIENKEKYSVAKLAYLYYI